jgi:hypothetical protein
VKLRNPSTSTSDQFLPVRYSAGETHDVAFVIDNISTTLYLDKEKVAGPISSLFSQKAFWIGYDLPPQTSVQAFIFDISFDEQ